MVIGQPASIDTAQRHRRAATSSGSPRRSQDGTVTVDVALDGELPEGRAAEPVGRRHDRDRAPAERPLRRPAGLRPGEQQVQLFKLIEDGKEAVRVPVELGRSSVSTIEIVEGLNVGDQVILSDTSAQDGYDRIRLN